MGSETAQKLPTVHLSLDNLKPGSSSWQSACTDIRLALEEYGCFVALYDQVSPEFRNKVFDSMEELFDLPQETKMKNVNPKLGHGYIGKSSDYPNHESMGIEAAVNLEECQKFTNLMWPQGNDQFCEVAHTYANKVAELQQLVTRMLFESYGIEKHFESHKKSTTNLLRFLNYPKVQTDDSANDFAFHGHTDKSFTTIIHTNHVKGLSFRTKDGEWIEFEPSPSSFVVIAGDACMGWSNDRIKSSYHRVVVDGKETRYGLGLFTLLNGLIQAPEELVDDEHPLTYKPFEHTDLLKFYLTCNVENKSGGDILKAFCGV